MTTSVLKYLMPSGLLFHSQRSGEFCRKSPCWAGSTKSWVTAEHFLQGPVLGRVKTLLCSYPCTADSKIFCATLTFGVPKCIFFIFASAHLDSKSPISLSIFLDKKGAIPGTELLGHQCTITLDLSCFHPLTCLKQWAGAGMAHVSFRYFSQVKWPEKRKQKDSKRNWWAKSSEKEMAGLLTPAVLHFSQRRCSQATCFHQDPLMFVTTEDLQLQLTGRTKHSVAYGILLPLHCQEGSAKSEDNNLQLNIKYLAQMGIHGVFQRTAS